MIITLEKDVTTKSIYSRITIYLYTECTIQNVVIIKTLCYL